MTLLEMATHVQDLANGPNILDAIDQYYGDDVTIVEASGDTFTGKQTQKDRVAEFIASVVTIHGGGLTAIAANETAPGTGIVFAESSSDMEFKEGRMQLEEVAVQRWEDGKIVHERFYYVPPPSE